MSVNKEYLGDGVYAAHDGFYNMILTTENGIEITNAIILEHEVIVALEEYIKKLKGE